MRKRNFCDEIIKNDALNAKKNQKLDHENLKENQIENQ